MGSVVVSRPARCESPPVIDVRLLGRFVRRRLVPTPSELGSPVPSSCPWIPTRTRRPRRAALKAAPGPGRDAALVDVLSTNGVPLEDEPEAEWAARVRERVEYLRQEARLELARDRPTALVAPTPKRC